MKWVNPGYASLFDEFYIENQQNSDPTMDGLPSFYKGYGSNKKFVKVIGACSEVWLSFNIRPALRDDGMENGEFLSFLDAGNKILVRFYATSQHIEVKDAQNTRLYFSEKAITFSESHNIEIHFKQGEDGRVDVWVDTKLFLSYRSPSAFNNQNQISKFKIGGNESYPRYWVSAIICQDTRRIGLEKFKKLTIDPDTEQNMPMGSTTTYKLSGLSDATEFSDITSVCAVLQATSRDANITTGTYSIEGADVGTIDVSDSSGKAYEIAHSESNSITGKPWVRDDIEGKTLSFTVNGTAG